MDRRLIAETKTLRGVFIAAIALSVTAGILIICQAFLLSRVINHVFLEGLGRSEVSQLLWALGAVVVLRAVVHAARTAAAARLAIQVKASLRDRIVRHIVALGPAFSQQERSGELTLTATEGVEALDAFFRDYLPALFISVLIPLTILIVVFPLDWLTFLVLLLTAPLIPIFMALIGMAAGALARQQYSTMSQMSAHFLDVMQGLMTLKLFHRSRQQIETIQRITDRFRETTMQVLRLAFLSAFVLELLATISVAIVAVEIGLRLLVGGIAFEQALFLLIIAPEFYLPLRELGAKFHAGRDGAAAADRIFTVLDTPVPLQTTQAIEPPPGKPAIRFEQVAVTYPDRPALRGISFEIPAGGTVAFVGKSGSGKTTIAHLLLRYVTPTSGRIQVNNLDLQQVDAAQWRQQIAWVSQCPHLFNKSIADNIRIGRPEASQQEITAAAQSAGAHEFIQQLEAGYETLVGERGARLSGGQMQRIALARAFLRDAPLYLFDEATASLDEAAEQRVMQAVHKLRGEHTVLIIAHQLHTIIDADCIFVLEDGAIVQRGTHAELLAQDGPYRRLFKTFGVMPDVR